MTIRTTTKTVTFKRPFMLDAFDRMQPAGTYTVETDEELLDTISVAAYRRIATLIHLHPDRANPGIVETVSIDPDELDAALMRDSPPAT
jgi:hypothetical protein